MGGVGELGFRRAAVHILSACVMDGWRSTRVSAAVDAGSGNVRLVDAYRSRYGDVEARARVASEFPGNRCRSFLHYKSVQSDYRLLPKRLRGTVGHRTAATVDFVRNTSIERGLPVYSDVCAGVWRYMAFECARRSNRHVFANADFLDRVCATAKRCGRRF